MMKYASIITLLLPIYDHSRQIQFGLDDPIADTEQYNENETKQTLDWMSVVYVTVHLASGRRRVIIFSTI